MIYNRPLSDFHKKNTNDMLPRLMPFLLGRNALNYLIKSLDISRVLLPNFICPIVREIFENNQVHIYTYDCFDCNFNIDEEEILKQFPKNLDGLLFFWHDYLSIIGEIPEKIISFVKEKKIQTITDATHSLPYEKYNTNYVIYGYRKILTSPFGAFLKADNLEILTREPERPPNLSVSIIQVIFNFKIKILRFLKNKKYAPNSLKKFFSLIDKSVSFDSKPTYFDREFSFIYISKRLEHIDYELIAKKRRDNFNFYLKNFQVAYLKKLKKGCPYGFPLKVDDNQMTRTKLWNKGIHSFILWKDCLSSSKFSDDLTKKIIILPVNHDLYQDDLKEIIKVVNA